MRANDTDRTPSWTLQYAVQQPTPGEPAEHLRGTPTPPYATLKQLPEFTPEIAAKCVHHLIVASGVINVPGQLEQVA